MTYTIQQVPKPIGLYRNNEAIGYFATSKEANDMFNKLTAIRKSVWKFIVHDNMLIRNNVWKLT